MSSGIRRVDERNWIVRLAFVSLDLCFDDEIGSFRVWFVSYLLWSGRFLNIRFHSYDEENVAIATSACVAAFWVGDAVMWSFAYNSTGSVDRNCPP